MKRRKKKASNLVRFVRVLILAYLGLCIAGCMFQNAIIFPGKKTQGTPDARVKPTSGQELLRLDTSHGETVYALFTPALSNDAATRPTLILFYGNGMCMADCVGLVDEFRRLKANVAVVEFPGYGMSSGKPSEKGIYAAAEVAYDAIVKRTDVDPKQIIAVGISIGGGAAFYLAAHRPVAAVATFSAFTSLPAVAHGLFPYLPVSWLISYRFDNEATLRMLNVPVFLSHGTADSLVPFWMCRKLAEAANGRATVIPVEGADHNDVFDMGGKLLMEAFGKFIEKVHDVPAP